MKTIKKHIGGGMPSRTVALVGFGTAAAITALLGVTQATPPSKVVSATVLARASFVDSVDLKFKIDGAHQEVIQAPQSQDTVMQQIIIGPGGHTGWHSHHGPAVALIKAGALALYPSDDPTCTPRIYLAGQAFVDSGQGHIHLGRNLSLTENVEVWVTYFDVPPGESVRLDAPDPGNCVF